MNSTFFRKIVSPSIPILLMGLLSACVANPGTVISPGQGGVTGAAVDQTYFAGGGAKTDEGPAPDSGSGSADDSGPASPGSVIGGVTAPAGRELASAAPTVGQGGGINIIYEKPLAGGAPSPVFDVGVHPPALDAEATICRDPSGDVILTISGFVGTGVRADEGVIFKEMSNDYVLKIFSQKTGETLADVPLESKAVGGVEKTEYVSFSAALLSQLPYPKSLYDLDLRLFKKSKQNSTNIDDDSSRVMTMKILADLPQKASHLKSCISLVDVYKEITPMVMSPTTVTPSEALPSKN